MTAPRTDVLDDPQTLAVHAAQWIANLIDAREGERFRISLTGGATPKGLYRELATRYRGSIDWSKVDFTWIDERFVPYTDPDSNYRMARETLLDHIPVPAENVYPIPTDGAPAAAAQRYEAALKTLYGSDRLAPRRPLFDLVLLGLGDDGHVCSLLPGQPVLEEKTRWVAEVPHGRPEVRITLTYPAVQSASMTAFLVTGEAKADAVRRTRAHDPQLPGGRLRPQGDLVWLLDRGAATLL